MKRISLLAVGVFLLCFIAKSNLTQAQGEKTSLRGHIYGVLFIPKEEMEKLPKEFRKQKVGKETIINFKDGSRETRVGIRGWTVSIGRKKAVADEKRDGVMVNGTVRLPLDIRKKNIAITLIISEILKL